MHQNSQVAKQNKKVSKSQKRLTAHCKQLAELGSLVGDCTFALGVNLAQVSSHGPEQAANNMKMTAQMLRNHAESIEGIANNIIEWDQSRIITATEKPLVDANQRPLTSKIIV